MGFLREKGNKYHAVFYVNGKLIERSTGIDVKGNNKRKAEQAMIRIIAEYKENDDLMSKELFVPFMKNWLKEIKGLVKPSTYETYDKTVYGKLIPYFEKKNYKLDELTSKVFTDYFKYLSTNGKSNGKGGLKRKSVKNIRGVLSAMMEYATENKYISENIISTSKMPVFEKDIIRETYVYSPSEVSALLETAKNNDSHIYLFLLLVCFTGLRKGEAMALTWDDIDFARKNVTINKSRTGSRTEITSLITTPKTSSSNRTIPLNDRVIEVLREWKIKQAEIDKDCKYNYNEIVRTCKGKPYNNLSAINRVVNRLIVKAGLPHTTIHGLRHAVASMLDENGIPLQDISILLGHENVSTTEKIYIHRNRKAKKETTDVLDTLII